MLSAPVPVLDQQPVSTDAAILPPPQQNQLQPMDPAKPADNQAPQSPRADQASIPQQIEGASVPLPVIDQQPVAVDAGVLPPLQNQQPPVDAAKLPDHQPLQDPITDQQPIERQQTESGQQPIDPLQEQQRQQDMQLQPAEPVGGGAQQMQQQEAVHPRKCRITPTAATGSGASAGIAKPAADGTTATTG